MGVGAGVCLLVSGASAVLHVGVCPQVNALGSCCRCQINVMGVVAGVGVCLLLP